jgi:hypothetical protein
MSGQQPSDHFESHAENVGYSNDDFEKVDASGFDQDTGDADSPYEAAGSGHYGFHNDSNQDAEISTTTDNAGEDEAEEDRYEVGTSEAEAFAYSSEPLTSLGEEGVNSFQVHSSVQPSAPVPDIEPIVDFANSSAADLLSSLATSAPLSSSNNPESIPTTSKPVEDFQTEKESKQVERSSQETTKGRTNPEQELSEPTTSADAKIKERISPLEETVLYQRIVAIGTWLRGVDPRVKDLIYWRDVKKTAVVFGTMLVLLLSLAICSLVSVVAYLSLAVLTVTFSFVVYKKIMGAVQKSNDGHPFKPLLDLDITLSEDKLKSVIQNVLKNTNCALKEARRLFLVEDTVDSIKFGLLLWTMAYIGSWFNGMSLIIIATVLLFTIPKVYETYQVPIDKNIDLAKVQINNVLSLIQSKVPFLKKKEKTK